MAKIQRGLCFIGDTPSIDKDGIAYDGVFFNSKDIRHEAERMRKESEDKLKADQINRKSNPDITWLRKWIN